MSIVKARDVVVDQARCTVMIGNDKPISLSEFRIKLLAFLMRHKGKICTQKDFQREVWKEQRMGPFALRDHINCIRKAMGDNSSNPIYIAGTLSVGYQFITEKRDK